MPEPLTRTQSATRYLLALVPVLFVGATRVVVLLGDRGGPYYVLLSVLDVVLAAAALLALHRRRTHPFATALTVGLLGVASPMAIGAVAVAYVSLCTHRRWGQIAAAAATMLLAPIGYSLLVQDPTPSATVFSTVVAAVSVVALTVLGLYVASTRTLTATRAEQAQERALAEQDRLEQARRGERERIAREMHDVLAHRLSLLSLHAAALAHRTDLSPEEVRAAAGVIQESAHQSLDELRGALGVLRQKPSDEAPQPSWSQLDALFDEVRAAGQEVTVTDTTTDRVDLPQRTGRHAYRVVQESLTNARKHAPHSAVAVELAGGPGAGLRIRVANPLDPYAVPAAGAGAGLVGLGERAHLLDGDLTHRIEDGSFVIEARLPWPAGARA